ncbi:hypothetical protein RJ639_041311 [Escallonia herrerae]|uniref:RNase H type-1 domain-containing protein n=1 Tax=Escallonia herrerae TaxID=1293975 RepID=A0AA89BAG6_9ASTE|nr:hypothetical protein RJ639_041311 [Escallonia herrerae]
MGESNQIQHKEAQVFPSRHAGDTVCLVSYVQGFLKHHLDKPGTRIPSRLLRGPLKYVYGMSRGNPRAAGAGGFIRNDQGAWTISFTVNLGIAKNMVAELWAFWRALHLAWEKGFSNGLMRPFQNVFISGCSDPNVQHRDSHICTPILYQWHLADTNETLCLVAKTLESLLYNMSVLAVCFTKQKEVICDAQVEICNPPLINPRGFHQ